MNHIYHAYFNRARKPENEKLRTRFSVFLICTIISVLLWGMIKLSREYHMPVKFAVVTENLPKDKVLTASPDSIVNITLKASGMDLYSRVIFKKDKAITVNLSNLALKQNGTQYSGFVRASKLINSFASQLPIGVEIISVEPDTVRFFFENSYRKKVRVKPRLSLDFSRQYQLYDSLRLSPDSIFISGKKEIVDTIFEVATVQRTFEKLKSNQTARIALEAPKVKPPLELSSDSITLFLAVEKFTEAQVDVPVSLISSDEFVSYRIFPEKVSITCRVAMSDYGRVDPSLFIVMANLDDQDDINSNRVAVEVLRIPSFVKIIRVEPQKVEYLILK